MRRIPPGLRWAILLIVAGAAAFWLAPLKVPYAVDSQGIIYPSRQYWILKNNDGSLFTTYRNYSTGELRSYTAAQVERGSQITFRLADIVQAGTLVQKGDTIGFFRSSDLIRRINQLESELANVKAELRMRSSGSKESLIQQARHDMHRIQRLAELHQKQLERNRKLYEKDLIPVQRLDSLETRAEATQLSLKAAQSYLEALQTGEKQETVNWLETRAEGLAKQISILREQMNTHIIKSPFAGRIDPAVSTDTLLSVTDTSRVVMMAVPWSRSREITAGQQVSITVPMRDQKITASILKVGNEARQIAGSTFIPAWAALHGRQKWIPTGLAVQCSIKNGKKSLWAITKSFIQSTFLQ